MESWRDRLRGLLSCMIMNVSSRSLLFQLALLQSFNILVAWGVRLLLLCFSYCVICRVIDYQEKKHEYLTKSKPSTRKTKTYALRVSLPSDI